MAGYRDEKHAIPGFNIIVLDVENSVSIDTAKLLLKDYTYFMHTTKRHTQDSHRFRIVMPISHTLELDAKDFRDFMQNVYDWLPFEVDRQTGQRSRKWMTYPGQHWYNNGELLDALQFIPKTKKADERRKILSSQTSLSNLERWFINNAQEGNRNNHLLRYAYCLVDMGMDIDTITNNVQALNRKLESPLPDEEILTTIIISASKKIHQKDTEKDNVPA